MQLPGICECGEHWEKGIIENMKDLTVNCMKCNMEIQEKQPVYGCFKKNRFHNEPKIYCEQCFDVCETVLT